MRFEIIYNDYLNFKGVGSIWFGSLVLGEVKEVYIVWLYVREFGLNYLENVNVMYGQFDVLYEGYVDWFVIVCE